MDLGLTDRVFVLTGASRGLGRATAEVARRRGRARRVCRPQRGVPRRGSRRARRRTARLPSSPTSPTQRAGTAGGRRAGAVSAAWTARWSPSAGRPRALSSRSSDDDWTRAFESVFLGAVRLARTIVPALGDGGSLAFVLSRSVKQPLDNLAVSNGLRPGLAMVVKSLADEVGPRGIRANGLMPGLVDTARVRELDAGAEDPAAARRTAEAAIPCAATAGPTSSAEPPPSCSLRRPRTSPERWSPSTGAYSVPCEPSAKRGSLWRLTS